MKICFIADGQSGHTQTIANYFAQKNHEVHLISYRFRKGYDSRIHTYQLTCLVPWMSKLSAYLSFWFWIFQVKRVVSRIKPDIINGHFITVYGLMAALTGFHPLVVTAWGSDVLIQPQRSLFWRYVLKYVFTRADLLTCLFDVNILHNELGSLIPSNLRMDSLPYGTDTNLFNKNSGDGNLRHSISIAATAPIIINTRSLAPIYNPETLVRAIPIVASKFPSVKFIVIHRKEQKNPCEKLIHGLHIEKNILILDWMPREKVADYLAISDIYVSTSLSDGASNALLEAMSCELAPVVTDIPANRYWVKDGENGFLFKPGDYTALAEKIICLLNDKGKRELFGKKCREIVCEKANYEIQMAKTEELYQKLAQQFRRKPYVQRDET